VTLSQLPQDRRQQLAHDLQRLRTFLDVLVAEAEHLHLPVPAGGTLESLATWQEQLTTANESQSSQGQRGGVLAPPA
jgi:hypothetical protein